MDKKADHLRRVDSFLARLVWTWERLWTLLLSTVGATVMTGFAKATGWISDIGPIAWGSIGLASFVLLYVLFLVGTKVLADARKRRSEADYADRLSERSNINPLHDHFVNERINLADLYSPYGAPLIGYTFKRCELIGPAVIFLHPNTVFRANVATQTEFIKIDPVSGQLWPNKIVMNGGSIENCNLHNVILLVPHWQASTIEATFPNDVIQWMNDPPLEGTNGGADGKAG